MPKTTMKVKRKRVQSTKVVKKTTKKTTKKKVVKSKKTVKKAVKKKITTKKKAVRSKKIVKRKRKKKITMEDVYKILNQVQIKKKKVVFAMSLDESTTAENIIKDTDLKYDKTVMKTQTVFTLYPNDADEELDILDIDYLDDEIPEEGQIFG